MENESILIEAARRGNETAFGALVNKYRHYVYSTAFNILKNNEEAEETAQDSFLKAYRALSSFSRRSKLSTWLYQITRRTAIDYYPSRPRPFHSLYNNATPCLQIADTQPGPDTRLQRQNTKKLIEQTLRQMKPKDAILLTLYYLNERSVKEIAHTTGLTETNVKVRLFRLRSVLKQMLLRNSRGKAKSLVA
ncbi:MAG TPA: sigma-70 family RNA polymerase sigma factor [Bacteroidetes bacterium]|nr:sigma-70 family RNA polymerase sigma factor [Bacteroidota bacterium]